jgi:EAL domain-containing protein (putative c-di-GMP-specific phosphodiesterase class I)
VLTQACAAAAAWQANPAPSVAVNVSVAQIVAGNLIDDVRFALANSALDPHRLILEVTESLFATDHDETVPTLVALRTMGIRISLDDFGTGFSSLGYLRSLPLDILKIDKSFVHDMEGESLAIVDAIQALARAFKLVLIAEGVETPRQAALLQAMGVTYLQGFVVARPLEEAAVPGELHALNSGARQPLITPGYGSGI